MQRYQNCTCDLCQKPLEHADEIVVCPVCGAPMHRACYAQHGACAHAAEHASGYEWAHPETGRGETVVCARCGAQNDPAARFCQLCGASLADRHGQAPEDGADGTWRGAYTYGQASSVQFDVNGVSSEEMRTYLGNSAEIFLTKFQLILRQRFTPAVWSIPALFFGPFYFFYRRMQKTGIQLLLILIAIYIPGYLYTTEYFKAFVAPEMFGITLPYNEALLALLEPVATVASWLRLALHFFCGIQANRFFLTHVIADIRTLHTQYAENERSSPDYRQALAYQGAPAAMTAVLVFLGFFAVVYGVTALRLMPILSGTN